MREDLRNIEIANFKLMKIVQLTTDNRNQNKQYDLATPYFGTAAAGLLDGFSLVEGVEVHVISCASARMHIPVQIAPDVYFHQPYVPKIGWGRTLFLGCAWTTRRLIQRINPDIVHGQGTERDCAMEAILSGFPNVLTIHGNMRVHASRPEQRGSAYYKMAAALETYCLKRTKGVVAISNYTKELVENLTAKTWVLPNAVDRRFFEVIPAILPVPRILFVGSLNERKNPLGLLQACERFLKAGECTLAMAGQFNPESDYGKKVMAFASSLPGIDILGLMDRDALAAEFARSTVLVLPTFEDNCPMVVLEAMAAGLPVAASRVGGVPDLVQEGVTGLMFDPNSIEAIRDSISQLLANPETRAAFGAAARNHALKNFHPAVIARSHVEIYREILS